MVYNITVHLYANSHPEPIAKMKAKLVEASRVFINDRETIKWFVMQDVHDPRVFCIVERFKNKASQKHYLEDLYWKTFDPYILLLLERSMHLRRHEELDTSKEVVVPE
ncbi:hypothetical protein S40293_10214 [Stachybotrys chartarum IBT 40293]|nr:hypothetical protein S40293_10214 [Stachybotrys chartarum IBT 40293]